MTPENAKQMEPDDAASSATGAKTLDPATP